MIKHLKRGLLITVTALLLGQTVLCQAAVQSLDRIVAVVNDAVITQSEIDKATIGIKNQMMAANVPIPSADVLHKQVLEQIINRKLQLQAAEQAGIHAKDEDVNKAISSIADQNKMSVAELYQKVTSQGMSKENYRKEISDEITLQQIEQQEIGSKISITPSEVKSFMHAKSRPSAPLASKEFHIEDLIVLLPENPSATDLSTAKKLADDLLVKINQGSSYKDIGKTEVNNKSVEAADLGWRALSEIPSAFGDRIQKMKKGSVIGPIQTANGFHIIHLADVRQHAIANTASAQLTEPEAQQMLYQQKLEAAVKKWVVKLRTQAVINMHP